MLLLESFDVLFMFICMVIIYKLDKNVIPIDNYLLIFVQNPQF